MYPRDNIVDCTHHKRYYRRQSEPEKFSGSTSILWQFLGNVGKAAMLEQKRSVIANSCFPVDDGLADDGSADDSLTFSTPAPGVRRDRDSSASVC